MLDVLAVTILKYDRLDPAPVQEMRQQKPRRAAPDDADLCSHTKECKQGCVGHHVFESSRLTVYVALPPSSQGSRPPSPNRCSKGVRDANLALTADAATTAASFVAVFVYVYSALIFGYVILSWIHVPYALNWLQRFLYDVCEPYIRIFRRFLPPIGPLDLSPLIAILALYLARLLINRVVIDHLH